MYIIARKSNREVVVTSGRYGNGEPSSETALAHASGEYGIEINDLSFFHIDDKDSSCEMIMDGASFDPVFEGGDICGVDFSKETSKPIISFSCSDTIIFDNGVDSTEVVATVRSEDGSVFEGLNGDVLIPVRTSTGAPSKKIFTFINGIGKAKFRGIVSGIVAIPLHPKRFDNYRVSNTITIEIIMS